jgi:hypothetical protein
MAYNRPYGNDFIVQTPHLDELEKRVYADHVRQQQQRYQENKLLDDEFARNLAGIRDADIGDLTKAYGDFKMSYQNMMKNRHGVNPEQQMDILRKKAAVYDVINKSKQQKDWEKSQGTQIMRDTKGLYADDAQSQLRNRMNTPISQLDESKDSDMLYKYFMPDLNKELKYAEGEPKDVTVTLGQNAKDQFKDDKEIYKVGSTPNQFYNRLLQGVVAGNKGRNFSGIVNGKYSDQELEDLKTKYYAKINDPKYISLYGEPQPFPESASTTDLGKAVATETMERVVNTPIVPTKKVSETNLERVTKDRQKFAIEQQARAAKNSLDRLYVYANIQDRKPEAVGQKIDGLIGQHIADGRENNGIISLDDATYLALTGQKQTKNSVTKIDENGNYQYGKYKLDDDGNRTGEIENLHPVPYELAKTKLTQKYKSGLDSRFNTGDKKAPEVKYSQDEERGISSFMKKNKLTREKAIEVLRKEKLIK